ncbi:MAG: glutamine--fructose-6-phosphate transaminase (isomerizing) [Verrucomicrobia bacterium]|nr:glutamine--fructose-6-phosphate transaminase (isomerizing) [Verrucomicrobiota bacterium]
MCGIFGYVGHRRHRGAQLCLKGLKNLEYRGYDSAGLAGFGEDGQLHVCKVVGKVAILEEEVNRTHLQLDTTIAHTRWATHGVPSEINAHPHTDQANSLAVVHNGIIENYEEIKAGLQEKGVVFVSDTDTEVIAALVSDLYQGDLLLATQMAMVQLKGAFAIAIVHQNHPQEIVVAARHCPLAIGVGDGEIFIASDTHAFLAHTSEVLFLADGEVARVQADTAEVFSEAAVPLFRKTQTFQGSATEISKGDFEHFMLKEIYEQPQAIRNALLSRYLEESGNASLEGLDLMDLLAVRRILILGCGTSWHAGYIASYTIEDLARIPCQIEMASEFRYKNPIVEEGTLVLAISQSGETADTLAAVRELKAKGARVIALCNVLGSSLVREANSTLLLRAGFEIGVASTKAFTSMLTVLSLFALLLARLREMSCHEGVAFVRALKELPSQVEEVLAMRPQIRSLARAYAGYDHFFFLGRRQMYPTALEGALKLKEISYINANGYPAGEMKHGPIALIGPDCPTVACCANKLTLEKMRSNLMEVQARKGPILAIVSRGTALPGTHHLYLPDTCDALAPILTTVATQLFAYEMAQLRGTEIDQPRNLAKSVTVE